MTSDAEGSSASARSGNDREERGESYGPITLTRHVKDDGRALILYSHRTSREAVEGRETVEGRGTSEDRRT